MRNSVLFAASSLFILHSSIGYSWGQKGHQLINNVAISMVNNPEAKKFLKANEQQITAFASTPDTKWKGGDTADKEKPLHWFELDGYGKTHFGESIADMILGSAQGDLGRDFVTKYGMAMWRVGTLYQELVTALKASDWKRSVQVGGVIGHYVGDMTQPMHSTSDYDGQSIGKPGVHKYYETTLVDRIAREHLYDVVVADAGERRNGLERTVGNDMDMFELQHLVYDEGENAFNAMSEILPKMDRQTDDEWLTADLQPRLARASAILGKIWDAAITTANVRGLPSNNVGASEPSWIPMK